MDEEEHVEDMGDLNNLEQGLVGEGRAREGQGKVLVGSPTLEKWCGQTLAFCEIQILLLNKQSTAKALVTSLRPELCLTPQRAQNW